MILIGLLVIDSFYLQDMVVHYFILFSIYLVIQFL